MIVDLPVHWRGRAVLHGMRTARDHLFRETVPVRIPELALAQAAEVCRREAFWEGANGRTITTLHYEGRFWRPVWRMSNRLLSKADLPAEFGQGELLGTWTYADARYVADGPKVTNERQPLPPDAQAKRWDSDDRDERIAEVARFVASRCTLFDGTVYEASPEPVVMAVPTKREADLDAPLQGGGVRIAYHDDDKRIQSDFLDSYPMTGAADCFRLDRMEAVVEHASARWDMDPDRIQRIKGFEVLRPDLLSYDDEELAAAATAAAAYSHLWLTSLLLPREAVEAVLDLRDARRAAPQEDRIGKIRRALSVLEDLDPRAVPPALQPALPKAVARLKAGVLRHEMFVAPVPDLLGPGTA